MIVVLMGVSGSGKTTVGRALAAALGSAFIEGDAFHPAANVEKMRRGEPLGDADRWPWLKALAAELARHAGHGEGAVLACSALRRSYREVLAAPCPGLRFVHLDGDKALIERRLRARTGHYMPAGLLASQYAVLEPPAADEPGFRVDVNAAPEAIVALILERLVVAFPAA